MTQRQQHQRTTTTTMSHSIKATRLPMSMAPLLLLLLAQLNCCKCNALLSEQDTTNNPPTVNSAAAAALESQSKVTALDKPDASLPCNARNVARYVKEFARSLMVGVTALREHATTTNVLLGSTVLATSVPLIAVFMQSPAAAHVSKAGGGPKRHSPSLQTRLNSLMGWIERSTQDVPSFPRLHPQECIKRVICEAHNQPTRFGELGFILRVFFPASTLPTSSNEIEQSSSSSSTTLIDVNNNATPTNAETNELSDFNVINKYKYAATFGKNERLKSNGTNSVACMDQYSDCRISLLEVFQSMMDLFTAH